MFPDARSSYLVLESAVLVSFDRYIQDSSDLYDMQVVWDIFNLVIFATSSFANPYMCTADVYKRFKRDGGRYFLCLFGEGSIFFRHMTDIHIRTAIRFTLLFMSTFGMVSKLPSFASPTLNLCMKQDSRLSIVPCVIITLSKIYDSLPLILTTIVSPLL